MSEEQEKYDQLREFIFKEFKKYNSKIDKLEKEIEKLKLDKKSNNNKSSDKNKSSDNKKSDTKKSNKTINKISGTVNLDKFSDKIVISGQTFNLKYILKKYKSIWNPQDKSWTAPLKSYDDMYNELNEICESLKVNIHDYEYLKNDKDIEPESEGCNNNIQFEFLDDE